MLLSSRLCTSTADISSGLRMGILWVLFLVGLIKVLTASEEIRSKTDEGAARSNSAIAPPPVSKVSAYSQR
ncbi:hypothetical protein EYF80_043219 [Liparis tanakae]|uniref:Uncharacterized protein n=1 Tax=Liparis tanakae TaxID=230148 RepID=A0A4Z2G0A2_9TELE|nr:hypothetical protein EYF80_043219 [Liparis tanakae]